MSDVQSRRFANRSIELLLSQAELGAPHRRRRNLERRIGFMKIREFLLTSNPAVLQTVAQKYRYRMRNLERRIGLIKNSESQLTFNPAVSLTVAKKYRYRRRNLERRIGAV